MPQVAKFSTIDNIIEILYLAVSFPPDGSPDCDTFRTLFLPNAVVVPHKAPGANAAEILAVEPYVLSAKDLIASNDQLRSRGFVETEAVRVVEQYADIVQVMSSYQGRYADDEHVLGYGVNSIQLMRDHTRWWIVSIMWAVESEGYPMPEKYLKPAYI